MPPVAPPRAPDARLSPRRGAPYSDLSPAAYIWSGGDGVDAEPNLAMRSSDPVICAPRPGDLGYLRQRLGRGESEMLIRATRGRALRAR
jgi:hypothetical protein